MASNYSPNPLVSPGRANYHQAVNSDMPLQMPSLTDRQGEKLKPSIYGGVMSGPAATQEATTAAFSMLEKQTAQGMKSGAHVGATNSSRPPTYQSTNTASKAHQLSIGSHPMAPSSF